MSFFITFEGIEGSGKSTQIRRLRDALKLRRYDVFLTREPGGTPLGDQIRRLLLDSANTEMVPLCELFLYAAARAQHVEEKIVPALKAGQVVLCDRFLDATTAYQGYGRGFTLGVIKNLNEMAAGAAKPELTFLLDCEPAVGLKRARARLALVEHGPLEDRFENEDLEFHHKVRDGYFQIAKGEPNRFVMIAADQDIEKIHQQILKRVLRLVGAPF